MVDDDYMLEILESAAPPLPSADVALEELRPRIRRARRRRAAMRGSAALVVLVVLGGLVSQTTSSQPSRELRVGETGTTAVIESSTTSVAPSTTVARSAGDGATPAGVGTPDVDGDAPVRGHPARARVRVAPRRSAPRARTRPRRIRPRIRRRRTAPQAAGRPRRPKPRRARLRAAAQQPGAPHVTTFESQAGTVEVVYTDTSMNIESVSPLPGWSVGTTEAGDAAIQVTFESESGEAAAVDVEVHLDDGVPVVGADSTKRSTKSLGGAADPTDLVARRADANRAADPKTSSPRSSRQDRGARLELSSRHAAVCVRLRTHD